MALKIKFMVPNVYSWDSAAFKDEKFEELTNLLVEAMRNATYFNMTLDSGETVFVPANMVQQGVFTLIHEPD